MVQLEELLAVRHSVFVIGNAGTGKSHVMRSLQRTYQNMKRRPVWADLNPKAVTNDELYGIINPATREWKDGDYHVLQKEDLISAKCLMTCLDYPECELIFSQGSSPA